MNPVFAKPVVEVVRGPETAQATLDLAVSLLARIGKREIVVADRPGFVANRVLMLAINEASLLVDEGVAVAEDVDRVFRECFGHPMGPLATADLIGLDTVVDTLDALAGALADPKYRPSTRLRELVRQGRLGQKSGEGFFSYACD
jgi:3-hydroxybutyryl-CoA dehydrogenase